MKDSGAKAFWLLFAAIIVGSFVKTYVIGV